MVCVACLLPLFLIPVVNALPLLFYFIMAKVYALFGWEYVKPVRAPPVCPYNPAAAKNSTEAIGEHEPQPGAKDQTPRTVEADGLKND